MIADFCWEVLELCREEERRDGKLLVVEGAAAWGMHKRSRSKPVEQSTSETFRDSGDEDASKCTSLHFEQLAVNTSEACRRRLAPPAHCGRAPMTVLAVSLGVNDASTSPGRS